MRTTTIDQHKPSPARVYAAIAGGIDSSEADREIAATLAPDEDSILPVLIRQNRRFLERSVRRLAGDGISRFLDLGAGPPIRPRKGPRMPMVHEVAGGARVIYVDNDPLVTAHLAGATEHQMGVTVIKADLADPDSPAIGKAMRELTAGRPRPPVAVIFALTLHYWRAGVAKEIVDWYMDELPAKSAAVITVAHLDEEMVAQRRELLPGTPFHNHGQQTVRDLFRGLKVWPLLGAQDGRHARVIGGVGIKR